MTTTVAGARWDGQCSARDHRSAEVDDERWAVQRRGACGVFMTRRDVMHERTRLLASLALAARGCPEPPFPSSAPNSGVAIAPGQRSARSDPARHACLSRREAVIGRRARARATIASSRRRYPPAAPCSALGRHVSGPRTSSADHSRLANSVRPMSISPEDDACREHSFARSTCWTGCSPCYMYSKSSPWKITPASVWRVACSPRHEVDDLHLRLLRDDHFAGLMSAVNQIERLPSRILDLVAKCRPLADLRTM